MTAIKPHNPTNRSWLTLTDEIDLANAADYLGVAREMIAECRTDPCFTIDLSTVTFMDSTALGMLVDVRKAASHAGMELRLAGIPWCVNRLLQITGLDDHLGIGEPGP